MKKFLNWILKKELIDIKSLFKKYDIIDVNIYNNEKLKFIKQSAILDDIIIKTPSKFHKIKNIYKTIPYNVYKIILKNGLSVKCADNHIFIDKDDNEIYAIDSLGKELKTELGYSEVISIKDLRYSDNMYDIEIDSDDDHTYYTNGILSHNTTCAAAFFLWYASFDSHKTILIVSNKESNATEFIHRVQVMYEYLPKWLKPGVTSDGWNKKSVGFDNGCRIISRATSESSARGLSLSLVFADELAFVRDSIQEAFWSALSPTLSTGGSLIVASTPDGDTNLFARLAREAENGLNEFLYIKYIWSDVPDRDEVWKQSELRRLGKEKFLQEHECVRISNRRILISSMMLQQLIKVKNPIIEMKEFHIWKEFENKKYIIGIDPSTGSGLDFSVIEIFEFPSMEQVAEFRDNVTSTKILYSVLKSVIKLIESKKGEVYYSFENNGIGEGLVALMDADENPPETAEFITQEKSNRPGFVTNNRSKMNACMSLKDMIEDGTFKIYSKHILTELKNYGRTRKGYEANPGATDDCISACLIVVRIMEEIIQFDDDAHALMTEKLDEDYFDESNNKISSDDEALPMVF